MLLWAWRQVPLAFGAEARPPPPWPSTGLSLLLPRSSLVDHRVPAILHNLCILRSCKLDSLLLEGSLTFHAISSSQSTNEENIFISLLVAPSMDWNKMLSTVFIYTLLLASITHLDNF